VRGVRAVGHTACAPVKDPVTGQYLMHQKKLDASGVLDDGEILEIDVSALPPVLGTATVTSGTDLDDHRAARSLLQGAGRAGA